MSSPTLLESQFELHSAKPNYGTAQEGVQLFDLETVERIEPESVGLSAELDTINHFMVSKGANPEHLKYMTIALFHPESEYGTIPGTNMSRVGFVEEEHTISGECGLRFPIVSLSHDVNAPNPHNLNKTLRHELGHLLAKRSVAPHSDQRLIQRLKTISATASVALAPVTVDMWRPATALHELQSGVGALEYLSGSMVASIGAIVATGMTYGLVHRPDRLMTTLSPSEYMADYFSHRNRDFQPFSAAH